MEEALNRLVQGQAERNVFEASRNEYLCRIRTLTKILYDVDQLRDVSLIKDSDGKYEMHCGAATGIYKLKLPMSASTGAYLFALVSIDESLPRSRKRGCQDQDKDNRKRKFNDILENAQNSNNPGENPSGTNSRILAIQRRRI